MDDGITVALTPVQLAAILAGQPVGSDETFANRAWGGITAIAGTLEAVAAAALLLTPEPTMATKVGGAALGVHASDTAGAGLWQLWTGQRQRTLTDQAAAELARRLGADPATAEMVGAGADIAVPLAVSLGFGAARIASIRAGRFKLIDHEAQAGSRVGGHTIFKHVGKTEAELRARLEAQRDIKAASTFRSLDVAERVTYQALRANRVAIEEWAKTAAIGRTAPFTFTAVEEIGEGVVRATGLLVKMKRVRVVLKMQAFKGKLYYVLTSFPVP